MKLGTMVLSMVAAGFLAGCTQDPSEGVATTDERSAVAQADTSPGVMCDKCKTVWVKKSYRTHKGMIAYRSKKTTKCPDCDSAAASFFRTGKLKQTCETCGGSLEVCQAQE